MIPSFNFNSNVGSRPINSEDDTFVALPPGFSGKVFRAERLCSRVIQHVSMNDIGALEDYLAKMVDTPETLAIYCDTGFYTFRCVLDHAFVEAGEISPNTNQHTATLKLLLSEEFRPLHAVIGKPMEQVAFMAFIEEYAHLFREAGPLLQMVETFDSVHITRFKSVKNQQNSMSTLIYETEEDAEQTTKVPSDVTISVPIFMGQPDTELAIKLRYDPRGGKVLFRLECFGLNLLILKAVEAVELRLREFCASKQWTDALIVRGVANLTLPEPEKVIDLETKPLPIGMGGNMNSYTSNQLPERR